MFEVLHQEMVNYYANIIIISRTELICQIYLFFICYFLKVLLLLNYLKEYIYENYEGNTNT